MAPHPTHRAEPHHRTGLRSRFRRFQRPWARARNQSISVCRCKLPTRPRSSMPRTSMPLMSGNFRKMVGQRLAQEFTRDRLGGRKLTHWRSLARMHRPVGSIPALREARPHRRKRLPVNDIASVQNPGGGIAGAPADLSARPLAGLSDATPVAPAVDAQPTHRLQLQGAANDRS